VGWRGTLVLALALGAAGVVLYREIGADHRELSWQSVIEGQSAAPPGEQITRLLAFDPATVTAVTLRRGDQEWHTERRAGGWSSVAQPGAIDDFLTNLLDLAEIMPIDIAPDELTAQGLNPPEGIIELQRRDLPPIVLHLGRHNPPATAVYAQLGTGGRVVLTGALARWELDKAVRALSPTAAAP
jgi:hypothetical protein